MAQFKKRVFGENVSKEVIEEFKKLAGGGLDGTSLQPLETRKPTFKKYLGERTPFSRMWCAVNINTLDDKAKNHNIILQKRNTHLTTSDMKNIFIQSFLNNLSLSEKEKNYLVDNTFARVEIIDPVRGNDISCSGNVEKDLN